MEEKSSKQEKPYESIFDAFRVIAPSSPLLQLETETPQFFMRTCKYDVINMGGYYSAFPGFPTRLFRGEYKNYPTCKASIYRSNDPDDFIVDELRCLEFKNILMTFPQVQYAIQDRMKVDFLALAQHYELNTRMIDMTSEPEIAAYFATHQWDNGVAVPVESGIGCIRGFNAPFLFAQNPKFHMIGLQCFQRPGIQAAYGIEMEPDEDLNHRGWRVFFKQNAEASRLIHLNFHLDEERMNHAVNSRAETEADVLSTAGWLFPQEEIADVAKMVKTCKTISRATVEEYGRPCEAALAGKGIHIVDFPVYTLTDIHRKELEELYKGRPYGDVQLTARMVVRK